MGRTVLRWLSTDAGALSRALRSADGKANEPSTIPPMDAISWRRLTSIVKSDLLSPKSEKTALAEVDFTDERSLPDNNAGEQRVTITKTPLERITRRTGGRTRRR